jgi:hypothetical protein
MFGIVLLLFAALGASAIVLAVEAGTGRLVGRTEASTWARAAVFFAASVAGGALLVAVSSQEWLLMLALAPITVLSLLRFAMLASGWWTGWRLSVYTAVLLLAGVAACLPWMPRPLDRAALLESLLRTSPTFVPDTISPDVTRPVRV